MTSLTDLLLAVQEKHLPKDRLEELHQDFLNLFGSVELEIADLEKEEALYLDASEEETEAAKTRKWKASEKGQRLITLKRWGKVIEKQMSSLRHRLYQVY